MFDALHAGKDKSTKKDASVVELTSAPPASVAPIPSVKVCVLPCNTCKTC